MNDDELAQLLHECEPALPEVDHDALVERLCQTAVPTKSTYDRPPRKAWAYAWPLMASTCAAGILALMVTGWSEPESSSNRSVESDALAASDHEYQKSLLHSEQLENELGLLLTSLGRVDSIESDSLWVPATAEPNVFADMRAELQASEGLWMLATDTGMTDIASPESIIGLYPNSPAAARCQQLANN